MQNIFSNVERKSGCKSITPSSGFCQKKLVKTWEINSLKKTSGWMLENVKNIHVFFLKGKSVCNAHCMTGCEGP